MLNRSMKVIGLLFGLVSGVCSAQHPCIGEFEGRFGLGNWSVTFFSDGSYNGQTKSCLYQYQVKGAWYADGDSLRLLPSLYRDSGSSQWQPYSSNQVIGPEWRTAFLRNDSLFVGTEGKFMTRLAMLRTPAKN